jgi:hypothetical protein
MFGDMEVIVDDSSVDLVGHDFSHVQQELSGGAPVNIFSAVGQKNSRMRSAPTNFESLPPATCSTA